MNDLLQRQLRELVDGPLPITFDEVLARGGDGSTVVALAPPRRRRRRKALVAASIAVAIVTATGVVIATNRNTRPSHVSSGPSSSTTPSAIAQPPRVVTGIEQPLTPVDMPSDLSDLWTRPESFDAYKLVDGTTPQAFTVSGSVPFAVAEFASGGPPTDDPDVPIPTPISPLPGVALVTMPVPGSVTSGIGLFYVTDAEIAAGKPALFNTWDWPVNHQRWVWARVPSGAAFVTATYGTDVLWQRPIDGVAAFQFDIPADQMNQPASLDDPVVHMDAYAADGTLVGHVDGEPR